MVAAAATLLVAAPPTPAAEAAAAPDGGVVTGVVRLARGAPRAASTPVVRDAEGCGDQAVDPRAGDARGLGGSVVWIEGVGRGAAARGEIVLEAVGCRFRPPVAAAMVGTRVRVRNGDHVLHGPRGTMDGAGVFAVALPAAGQVVDVTRRLTRPGVIRVGCAVHPHMTAWLVLHDTPYVAVTDALGAYRFEGVPPGTWTVTAWRDGARRSRRVTVRPGATTTADFELR